MLTQEIYRVGSLLVWEEPSRSRVLLCWPRSAKLRRFSLQVISADLDSLSLIAQVELGSYKLVDCEGSGTDRSETPPSSQVSKVTENDTVEEFTDRC